MFNELLRLFVCLLFFYQFSYEFYHLQDIRWLRSITSLPILIKGILTHEDGMF